ncbi:LacI family DNA-binding transcriptional regulator [Haloimpatiens sp. FM7330]|uniref:LacI family DNA-binding transcriptional regulator n=1 Tax=Haloimpatiens sp. FM7330 TaxID=3298610 RepID=UPI00362C7CD8
MAVTIYDIAKKADVSRSTVSRVLNDSGYVKEETREKIIKVMKELNYTPSAIARSLSTNKTNTIGVVIPEISNPFFGKITKGISEVADKNNYNIILCDTNESVEKELKALKVLKEQRIQGIIITPTVAENEFNSEYLNALENLGIPIVLLDGHIKYSDFNGVFVDHIKGACDATQALLDEGHRKIAIITGRMESRPAKERLNGYKKALAINNIPVDEKYIFYGDYTHEKAYEITKQIMSMEDRPTAIFVSSNIMILGCIRAFYEENIRIPEDMAIIGFDEVDTLNIIGMNISFVSGPTTELGRTSMKMLIQNLKDKDHKDIRRINLLPKLVLRGSEKRID